jgi:hypothetical protein
VKPTVFVNVTNKMTIAQEEIFGRCEARFTMDPCSYRGGTRSHSPRRTLPRCPAHASTVVSKFRSVQTTKAPCTASPTDSCVRGRSGVRYRSDWTR